MITSNDSFLRGLEKRLIEKLCGFIPPFIGTKILTSLSLGSSLLILLSYYLSNKISAFLFVASFFIIMQWIFDCLDGEIGRLRREGLVRWGFYMDHLFDYFFMFSIIFGFWFIFPHAKLQILFLFFLFSAFMVNFFLLYSVLRDKEPNFTISFGWFSPIEFRLLFILFNSLFYFFESGMKYFIYRYLSYFNIFLFVMLIIVIYSCQKKLSKYDILEKQ